MGVKETIKYEVYNFRKEDTHCLITLSFDLGLVCFNYFLVQCNI